VKRLLPYRIMIARNLHSVPGQDPLFHQMAYRLWRSHPHYRKACRILRRAGIRVGKR
jgi:hypothetical protein